MRVLFIVEMDDFSTRVEPIRLWILLFPSAKVAKRINLFHGQVFEGWFKLTLTSHVILNSIRSHKAIFPSEELNVPPLEEFT